MRKMMASAVIAAGISGSVLAQDNYYQAPPVAASSGGCANGACGGPQAYQGETPIGKAVHHVCQIYERNKLWPKPFVYADRASARAPFYAMVARGWQTQTTLEEFHFVDGGADLTANGQNRIKYILTQAPANWRTIYFAMADDQNITAQRQEAIAKLASNILPEGVQVPIQPVLSDSPGWPGAFAESTLKKYNETIPAPRLPPRQSDSEEE